MPALHAGPLAAAVLIAALIAVALVPRCQRTPSAATHPLAYALYTDGQWDVWTAPLNGEAPAVNVTRSRGASELMPAWSPDGTRLAVEWVAGSANRVRVLDPNGRALMWASAPQSMVVGPLSWSPDGLRIAYCEVAPRPALALVDVAAPDRMERPDGATGWAVSGPAWSPDGRSVVYTKTASAPARPGEPQGKLVCRDLGTGHERVLSPDGVLDCQAAWSPDGSRVAFTRYRDGSRGVWTMSADGSDARQLGQGTGCDDYYPAWSPDGARILFISDRDVPSAERHSMPAPGSIYSVPPTGGGLVEMVRRLGEPIGGVCWRPGP